MTQIEPTEAAKNDLRLARTMFFEFDMKIRGHFPDTMDRNMALVNLAQAQMWLERGICQEAARKHEADVEASEAAG